MKNMRKTIIVFAIVLTALAGLAVRTLPALSVLGTPTQSADREVDRREILRAYESARAAHFNHDAAAFLASNDANWYVVADGSVGLRATAAEKPGVQKYFDSVKFAEVTDLDPPHVEVSSDGTMAWLLGHVRVRGTQRDAKDAEVPLAFDAAWIDIWQKKGGSWRIVARANTEKDNAPPH
jgi:ketosteroid isomerase-like protein